MEDRNFKDIDFSKYPSYNGDDLGLLYSSFGIFMRIWAPTALRVFFRLYKNGIGGVSVKELDMVKDVDGTWTLSLDGNWNGWFYTIQVKDSEGWLNEIPDIYARTTGVSGLRGMIYDPLDVNPDGWGENKLKKVPPTDMVIYETHVRDFTISQSSEIKNRGRFLGFTEKGTRSRKGDTTGLDHLKEMGITHVQLLPVADFYTVDETKKNPDYNWGYDPLNYNTPEGWYSTDARNGKVRVKELKQLVKALHDEGIGIIFDVVYNHTGLTCESYFNQTVPGYFYRHNPDGTFSNASGCGNETASEREMVRKYIIDSIIYWATEYHADGFRFDLMGIHDIVTMNEVREALDKIDPGIFVYGEGWTAGSSPLDKSQRAVKSNASKLNKIAMFSDNMRDSLKGSIFDKHSTGFISGAVSGEEKLKFSVTGSIEHDQVDINLVDAIYSFWASSPEQCVNYVSCHDNFTLFDKLRYSRPDASTKEIERMARLAMGVILTSQGVPFLHSGVEMLRTKGGRYNSYCSPDAINKIDWARKHKFRDFFNYVCSFIKLRKDHPAFRMKQSEMVKGKMRFLPEYIPGTVCYELGRNANNDSWARILILCNGNNHSVEVNIPHEEWSIIAQDGMIDARSGLGYVKEPKALVHPISIMILAV